MTITGDILLPTAYFPPISYFVHMIRSKVIYIEQMETFTKQTFRNRCEIMTASGKSSLVVPVTKPQGNHTMTKQVEICYREHWQEQHWKTLQTGYRSSPFFNYYTDILEQLFETQETSLINNNHNILKTISALLGIDLNIQFTQDYEKKPGSMLDLRSAISPKKYQPFNQFPKYPQVFDYKYGFVPNLSILDLLFNMGPEAGRYLDKIVMK
ncbi:MAG: WbqC family protein [Bacteroidales bacterium]|nr:WbqC family protein [Bacteroidales bacterium]